MEMRCFAQIMDFAGPTLVVLCAAAAGPACSSDSKDDGSQPKDAGISCDGLDEDACESKFGCAPLKAWDPKTDSGNDRVFVACARTRGCDDSLTCAFDDEGGEPLVFPSTCIPAGWVETDACWSDGVADAGSYVDAGGLGDAGNELDGGKLPDAGKN